MPGDSPSAKSRAELLSELKTQPPPLIPREQTGPVGAPVNHAGFLGTPLPGATRWQYAVVNVGSFNTSDRMSQVLAAAGSAGWELVTVYDKSSNWIGGMEKGFMLLKRPVPAGVDVGGRWCITYRG